VNIKKSHCWLCDANGLRNWRLTPAAENEGIEKEKSLSIERPTIGTWVVIRYDNEWYPGVVKQVLTDEVEVDCMERVKNSKKNHFHWPKAKDCIMYNWCEVVCTIDPPVRVPHRNVKFSLSTDDERKVLRQLD
jgi:hypothetical protein